MFSFEIEFHMSQCRLARVAVSEHARELLDWTYEFKFDGYRALGLRGGGETRVMCENKKDLGKKIPAIAGSIAKLDGQVAIIEGKSSLLARKIGRRFSCSKDSGQATSDPGTAGPAGSRYVEPETRQLKI
jgi:hypothetical protein